MILAFSESLEPAQALARTLNLGCHLIDLHTFPDGEIKVRLPLPLPSRVIIFCSLHHPNEKLIALLLVSRTARAHHVQELTLIAPYLCYMRQDRAFTPGEAISQVHIGRLLAELFDRVVTVDPHLHRIESLAQVVPAREVLTLSAAPLIADYLHGKLHRPLILGPDAESRQWAAQVAHPHGNDYDVCAKVRQSDTEVSVALPPVDVAGRDVALVDDIISTGKTLLRAAIKLRAAGVRSVSCFATHALISSPDLDHLRNVGIENIWSTDAVPHPTNVVTLTPILQAALSGTLMR